MPYEYNYIMKFCLLVVENTWKLVVLPALYHFEILFGLIESLM